MKKIFLLIPLLLLTITLIGCSKSKQEIVDKCLVQANEKFPIDMTQKSRFFQDCMGKHKYAFNAHSCDLNKQDHVLSKICYVKY
jgi:hypothetical protein